MTHTKKILSFVLALVFVFTSIPLTTVFAAESSDIKVEADSVSGLPGEEVTVDVKIKGNPGIVSPQLNIAFGDGLTLIKAEQGSVFSTFGFTKPNQLINGIGMKGNARFTWSGDNIAAENIKDGTILTLTFKIDENAELGKTYSIKISGMFIDTDLNDLLVDWGKGSVTVIDYIPGDVNNDNLVNSKDVTLICRYIVDGCKYDPNGYAVNINASAADVNDDGLVNSKDVTLICRYIVDGCQYDPNGYGVVLKPSSPKCNHNLEAVAARNETCTEDGNIAYWHCDLCDKYFSNENATSEIALENIVIKAHGHTIVIDPAVAPTYTSTGLTEGQHCSECGTIIAPQEVIPMLQKEEYAITYHLSNNDAYLQSIQINNPNPNQYTAQEGLKLANLNVPGYVFEGWYDGAGANGELIKEIPKGTTGNVELYARWSLVEYTVQFDSPDVPVASVNYTVDTGVPLINPAKQFGYTFVGWSNDDGFLVSKISAGTTGNIILHANWTSNRNKATSYATYDKPIIIEDDINGQFMFIYDIGKIDNIPLSQISYLGNSDGIEINQEYDVSSAVTKETAEKVANMVANATTKSSGWTLSDEWEKIYSAGSEEEESKGKTAVRTDSEGNVTGGNYYVSNSSGGSSFVSNSSGGSNSSSSKVTTNQSVGINRSYDNKNEAYVDAKLGVSNTTEANIGVSIPIKVAKVEAGVKNSTTVSAEVAGGLRNENSQHYDDSYSGSIGTYDEHNSSSYYNSVVENSSTWNTASGYEKSYQTSRNAEVSNAISEQISKKTNYNLTDSLSGSKSTNASDTYTDTSSEEYSSSVRYNSEEKSTTKQSYKFSSKEQGYYRLVNAGTVHVFAVVTYDVATNSYYTYTYNVLDDERHVYTDFSLSDPNFGDCENGVVTFEVPYEVNEYVVGLTGKSEGLQFTLDGSVSRYTSKGSDETVVVPQYYSANNGADASKTAVKVTKIGSNVFKGNTNIKTVVLPLYVSEIPDGAFEGCTNLETVIAYGVTKIGANAFKGCTKLNDFKIDNMVTMLGANAFEGVNSLKAQISNESVFDAVFNSGAKRITINTSKMQGTLDNKRLTISNDKEYFALLSNGISYSNLQIVSDAKETYLSNMTLTNNTDTPLRLNSSKVTLNRVTVEQAPGFALILENADTNLSLFSLGSLSSKSNNAVLSKNVVLTEENSEVMGELKVYGEMLVCGAVQNEELLSVLDDNDNKYKQISEDEFKQYLTSSKVTFNPNGGTVLQADKTVTYGASYGDLPVPSRPNYTFAGWYTEAKGGVKVTKDSVVTSLVNQTVYAHWTPNSFTLTYNANGGSVSTSSKTLKFGDSYGTLPTPKRDYYDFVGWFTKANGGEQVFSSTIPTTASNVTVYAHWTQKGLSGWVKASDIPSGAEIINKKWSYTLTSYTTSSSSTMSGWTKYDTSWVWGDYGSWSGWSDAKATASDSRQVETRQSVASTNYKTVYHYFRYAVNKTGGYGNTSATSSYPNYFTYDFDSPLEANGTYNGYNRYKYWYNGTNYISVYACSPYTTQEVVSYNYKTQYRYRDRSKVYTYYFKKSENKESTTNPTGQKNVSDIQEWVQYRAK